MEGFSAPSWNPGSSLLLPGLAWLKMVAEDVCTWSCNKQRAHGLPSEMLSLLHGWRLLVVARRHQGFSSSVGVMTRVTLCLRGRNSPEEGGKVQRWENRTFLSTLSFVFPSDTVGHHRTSWSCSQPCVANAVAVSPLGAVSL